MSSAPDIGCAIHATPTAADLVLETKEDIVSSAERFVRHHKRQTDRAISQAYLRLATHSRDCSTFTELLHGVRKRAARVLAAPVVNGHHLGIEALVNLSRFTNAHVRPLAAWSGSDACWQGAMSSLTQHLVGKYPVPPFLASAWYAMDEAYADRKREWFVAHAGGASLRSLDLPIRMTRRMEHIFLSSHHHVGIEFAMRRAELRGLGVPDALVQAVLATRLATDLRNCEFWRTVWTFLMANARDIEAAQVGPIIDFIQAVRHERVTVERPEGIVMRDPPQPSFSMKGRTLPSVLRLMQDWHRSLGGANGGLTWPRSPLRPMVIEEPSQEPSAPPAIWHLIELTNGAQLRTEGTALHHCVASYADRCWRGASRIWSLRVRRGEKVRHVLTIEVDMKKRAVVQARGWGNRTAAGKPFRLVQEWAVRERLRLVV
jgi:hypothetical protein